MSFREMKDYELAGLPDEELIAYVVRARKAGALDAARTGLGVFCHRRWDDLVARALVKMPSKSDAEDVAAQTVRDVFRAAFDGQSVGEAVRFMQRVLARRIADWYEARKQTEALPEDAGDDEEWHGYDAAVTPDETGGVDAADAVERVYGRLSSSHQEVIDDFGFAGYGAKETAERVNKSFPDLDTPMSEQNVHKIASRFRQDLRGELGLD
jgi:DNA-directed RNA polymerase specialized sigma24 family protein